MRSKHLHEICLRLSDLLESGQSLERSLGQLESDPVSSDFKRSCAQVRAFVGEGAAFSSSVAALRVPWFSSTELVMLRAGERSGSLPVSLRQVARLREGRQADYRDVVLALAYPVGVVHLLFFAFPIKLFQDLVLESKVSEFLMSKFLVLAPSYALLAFLAYFLCSHDRGLLVLKERIALSIPVLRALWQARTVSRASEVMVQLLQTDLPLGVIWLIASESSSSPRLVGEATRWKRECECGSDPGLSSSQVLPSHFVRAYTTGAQTGKLQETLVSLHAYYTGVYATTRRRCLMVLGTCAYLGSVLATVICVVGFFVDYFNQIFLPR